MKQWESPIRRTSVTHIAAADARGETSGPVRRGETEAAAVSRHKESLSSNRAPSSPRKPYKLPVIGQLCGSNEQIHIKRNKQHVEKTTK